MTSPDPRARLDQEPPEAQPAKSGERRWPMALAVLAAGGLRGWPSSSSAIQAGSIATPPGSAC